MRSIWIFMFDFASIYGYFFLIKWWWLARIKIFKIFFEVLLGNKCLNNIKSFFNSFCYWMLKFPIRWHWLIAGADYPKLYMLWQFWYIIRDKTDEFNRHKGLKCQLGLCRSNIKLLITELFRSLPRSKNLKCNCQVGHSFKYLGTSIITDLIYKIVHCKMGCLAHPIIVWDRSQ